MSGASNFFGLISESKIKECYMCPHTSEPYDPDGGDKELKQLRKKSDASRKKLRKVEMQADAERNRIRLTRATKELKHLKTITEGTGGVKRSEKRARIAAAKARNAKYPDKQNAEAAASRAVNRADYVGLKSEARKSARNAKTGPQKKLAQAHSANAEEVIPKSARSSREGGFKALNSGLVNLGTLVEKQGGDEKYQQRKSHMRTALHRLKKKESK